MDNEHMKLLRRFAVAGTGNLQTAAQEAAGWAVGEIERLRAIVGEQDAAPLPFAHPLAQRFEPGGGVVIPNRARNEAMDKIRAHLRPLVGGWTRAWTTELGNSLDDGIDAEDFLAITKTDVTEARAKSKTGQVFLGGLLQFSMARRSAGAGRKNFGGAPLESERKDPQSEVWK